MNDLVDTTEMYLRTILELEEEGVPALRARIAERLQQSGPTVSQTVARMERDGLLNVEGDRHLALTDLGRAKAVAVMRKHRLAELLLVNVIGMPYEEAHDEACRWEHVMSEAVEQKVYELLGRRPAPRTATRSRGWTSSAGRGRRERRRSRERNLAFPGPGRQGDREPDLRERADRRRRAAPAALRRGRPGRQRRSWPRSATRSSSSATATPSGCPARSPPASSSPPFEGSPRCGSGPSQSWRRWPSPSPRSLGSNVSSSSAGVAAREGQQ